MPNRKSCLTHDILDLRALRKSLASFQRPSTGRSLLEILLTVLPLAILWPVAWWAASIGAWWLALLLSVPSAAFVVRLFAIQHDCGHRSFFRSGMLNDWVGRFIGVVTLTPFDCWRQEHAIHHATSGNLDRRGPGAVLTLTVDEYLSLNALQRFGYRLYRHPVVLFLVGPFFVFFLQQRLPVGLMKGGWRPWLSAMGTNAALALFVAAALAAGGWQALLLVHVPTLVVAASIGVWLFYVQHQFEQMQWERQDDWDHTESALHGSSHYDLPSPLRWVTGNIGIHHVHHIASRIPFYRLPTVLRTHPRLKNIGRLTLMDSIRCVGLALWDEAGKRLVSFNHVRETAHRSPNLA